MDPFWVLVSEHGGWKVVCCPADDKPVHYPYAPNYVVVKDGLTRDAANALAERLRVAFHEDS